jgi:hypothetical protein
MKPPSWAVVAVAVLVICGAALWGTHRAHVAHQTAVLNMLMGAVQRIATLESNLEVWEHSTMMQPMTVQEQDKDGTTEA